MGLVELIREESHSCYLGERSVRHEMGLWLRNLPGLRVAGAGDGRRSRKLRHSGMPRRGRPGTHEHRLLPNSANSVFLGSGFAPVRRPGMTSMSV